MSIKLFEKLTEEFNSPTASLVGFADQSGTTLPLRKHYDIRSFYGDDITVPRTMLDLVYNNITNIDGSQMVVLDNPQIIQGHIYTARLISDIENKNMGVLDPYTQSELDIVAVGSGNESWPSGDPNVTVGKNSARRYANSIRINLTGGVSKTVASTFSDNLLVNFDNPGSSYFIELVLPDFPVQQNPIHLDLDNSWIDFTSDSSGGYDPAQTDSFRFNDSLNPLVDLVNYGDGTYGTGMYTYDGEPADTSYWRINRNSITHADLTNIKGIRFRLLSVGNMTFEAMAMRLIKNDEYTFDTVDVETKRNKWVRAIGRGDYVGEPEPTTITLGGNNPIFMGATRPKNVTQVVRFNSGHLPAASANSNRLELYARHTVNNTNVSVRLDSYAAQTRLRLTEKIAGISTTIYDTGFTLSPLSAEKDYVLVFEVYENDIKATIYNIVAATYGSVVVTTGLVSTNVIQRGLTGFYFLPYYYDFTMDYVTVKDAEFARFQSTNFQSILPVSGATILTQTMPAIDITEGLYIAEGDATIIVNSSQGLTAVSDKITRTGAQWEGGLKTETPVFIGNPKYLKISGDILPSPSTGSTLRGSYRVLFVDKQGSIGWISNIQNLLPNQWNHFDISINDDNLLPANYQIVIQQTGFYNDIFNVRNLKIEHLAVAWEVSPNGGGDWYPFLTAKDSRYTGVNFRASTLLDPGTYGIGTYGDFTFHESLISDLRYGTGDYSSFFAGLVPHEPNNLVVRSIALADTAWVSSYELLPRYAVAA